MKEFKRKIKKIVKVILAYLTVVYWKIRPLKKTNKPVAFLFHVSKWKQSYLSAYLDHYDIRFVPFDYKLKFLRFEIEKYPTKVFMIWGFNHDDDLLKYAKTNDIPVQRIEDGFVRSKGLGSMHTPPFSICIDKKGMYFDASQPSDLEEILNNYPFKEDQTLLLQAKQCIGLLINLGISKYNHIDLRDIHDIYGKKIKKRILVIGQVEDDASILKGSIKKWTNNDLVRIAYKENPDAEIIYKPHPDVLTGRRQKQSNPVEVKHLAKIIEEPLSLVDSLQTIDHVYTITSLSGFEALLRGIPVTTLGAPFYSGWGLTDDRQLIRRRKRKLTVEELFAGAYILYPLYRDPYSKEVLTLEETIKRISNQ
ncbi:capsular polysaccharide biosynthesis protein [Bacillus timonensis]|uniref:Capsular polysaccharide biosynthesis protein n=1 Tax=Bacillus timonensis TaxID=1033734 RepID=A0A4V3V7D5_9BACI|nr:capsular polysaccharide biosynthesis protein [Bacillus timonensis]THE11023.1 capsular polysaccharide biosynthesis protein [Bacillus timonensis]